MIQPISPTISEYFESEAQLQTTGNARLYNTSLLSMGPETLWNDNLSITKKIRSRLFHFVRGSVEGSAGPLMLILLWLESYERALRALVQMDLINHV
ncbi:hypothetical protein BOTNAR_0175g00020 [Botryotinia narcissicola]|uniref:Uncharacterized protein n=1 Tax=Botryotinia narcissicola TaxID=278944 RepID=A0A4Z1IAW1_9HELO|nr:hypothetical protein BOTNAR_0175g00020 [Botryotinia narcissicola]